MKQRIETDVTDACFKEHVEILEEVGVLQTSQYSKNQAFDDLMDVLRDDQGSLHYLFNVELFSNTVFASE